MNEINIAAHSIVSMICTLLFVAALLLVVFAGLVTTIMNKKS